MNGEVRLQQVFAADAAEIGALLTQRAIDLASFAAVEGRIDLPDSWTLARRTIEEPVGLTVESEAYLLVVAGRVEFIPTDGGAELIGEGQVRRLDRSAALRTSSGTKSATVVEIAAVPLTEHPVDLDDLPLLRDYYYGYSDRYASVYAAGAPLWEPAEPNDALVHALDKLSIEPCAVIDLGCGEGRDSNHLAALGFDVVGVDVARPALTKARERAAAQGRSNVFLERDICVLADLPRDNFDLAINMGCLHMIPDADLRAAHLARVHDLLKLDGIFLVAHCKERWLDGFFSVPDYESVGPVVPGRVIPRRIRLADGTTTEVMLPLVPYKETPTEQLIDEICRHGFELVADLSSTTAAFGSTTVLALRKRDV